MDGRETHLHHLRIHGSKHNVGCCFFSSAAAESSFQGFPGGAGFRPSTAGVGDSPHAMPTGEVERVEGGEGGGVGGLGDFASCASILPLKNNLAVSRFGVPLWMGSCVTTPLNSTSNLGPVARP